jgi:hypothetical protein
MDIHSSTLSYDNVDALQHNGSASIYEYNAFSGTNSFCSLPQLLHQATSAIFNSQNTTMLEIESMQYSRATFGNGEPTVMADEFAFYPTLEYSCILDNFMEDTLVGNLAW